MKRAPIVIAGTVAGLLGVLEFHTSPAKLTGASLPAAPAASLPASSGNAAGTASGAGAGTAGSGTKSTSGSTSGGSHTAAGPGINYYFGVVSVKVTVSGGKIVKVGIASLNDGANPRSQFIDQQSIPVLEQEVIKAQSANIQGVSGASYTSAGFDQSLQSALHRLGFT
jgi:uncharacterized protein with FMN-binding domain